jgi:PPOX class probable F420-dependent enzyme
MTTLADFAETAAADHNYCVVATTRRDGSMQASVVSAGVMDDAVVFVAVGGARKLANLRRRPRTTLVARAGGAWVAVEGDATLIGPDDPADGVDAERLRLLLREAFVAAGGTHDDWDTYDRVMRDERRTVVRVSPTRVYSNG